MSQILREIGTIARALDSISNVEFKEAALTKGQYLYVIRIYENPGIIQEKLAEMLKVDRTTAARAVVKLISSGLIEKRDDPENKKIKHLFPTEKADPVYEFLMREDKYSGSKALVGFSNDEKELALSFLERIRENIEADWELVKKGKKRPY